MKQLIASLVLFAASGLLAQQPPSMLMTSVPDFLKFPSTIQMGEAAGVAVNSKGHVFVFNRGQHPLMEFDAKGNFIRSIDEGLYGFVFPHFVRVDADDNIWAIDGGSGVIIKMDSNGKVLMLLGRRPEPSEAGQPIPLSNELFNRPTDVAFDAAGDIFVADGYGNSRIVKYDKNGKFVKTWGQRGVRPGEFNLPHSIAIDSNGLVYVADRENYRIQVFDTDGKFIKQWNSLGSPWTLCLTQGPKQTLYVADGYQNRIFKVDLDGNILGAYGETGRQLGQFINTHGLSCNADGDLFVAETRNWRVQKLVPNK
jgi:DNA-binding beta-propeller fold protein YncE